jgi:hypothetical protein
VGAAEALRVELLLVRDDEAIRNYLPAACAVLWLQGESAGTVHSTLLTYHDAMFTVIIIIIIISWRWL